MTHKGKRSIAFLAGMMATLTAGCITGPRTFSSTQVPTTKYVSFEERPVPVFDIPSASQNSDLQFAEDDDCATGQVISLQQQ